LFHAERVHNALDSELLLLRQGTDLVMAWNLRDTPSKQERANGDHQSCNGSCESLQLALVNNCRPY
jgi:hypothetical protein